MGGTWFSGLRIAVLNITFIKELLSWYTDPASHGHVLECEREVIELLCKTESSDARSTYPNWSRDGPLEHMYPGDNRLQKLKALKRKWDPNGVFTPLFL